jgi:pimeloyl-ACP methyl ester carboxylesterase
LRGLVLATSSGLPRKTNSPAPNAAPPDPAWAADDAHRPRAFYDWKLGTLLCRPMDAAARQALLDEVAAMNELPGRAMEARLRLAHHDADALSKALPHVAVPVLIQWSSDSLYLPSEQAERIGALTGGLACVRHYPGTGHLLLIDAAAECARDLLLFLETLS